MYLGQGTLVRNPGEPCGQQINPSHSGGHTSTFSKKKEEKMLVIITVAVCFFYYVHFYRLRGPHSRFKCGSNINDL